MDTKKLEKWANLLLDTGKRNNLISFKDTKASTVEVVIPSSEELLRKADSTASFEVFDPKIEDDEDEDYNDTPVLEDTEEIDVLKKEKLNRSEYIELYSSRIRKTNQILLYNANVNPVNALNKIAKKAKEHIEETGNNVAYMAMGFVHWKEGENSSQTFKAPLILVPISLSSDSAVSPWFINMTEDDVVVNPTFSFKIQNEYGITLPEYNDESLTEYLQKVDELVSKLGWRITDECKIGIFSFLKLNMYKDLKNNLDSIIANTNVKMLLGEADEGGVGYSSESSSYKLKNPLIELHNVVDADSSQIEAIEMAKAGISFVLQGPPGTGKSQTITNIIAECINDGKKVLFVSEKQAALNVVFDKLKKVGLEEFCLELHSHKANKKEVISNLCKTLRTAKTTVSDMAGTVVELKENSQKKLDDYEYELHLKRDVINRTLYQLYEDYASCGNKSEVKILIDGIENKGDNYLNDAVNYLSQFVEFIPSVGYQYKKNPWYGYINKDTSYQTFEKVKEAVEKTGGIFNELTELNDEIKSKYGFDVNSVNKMSECAEFMEVMAESDILTPSIMKKDVCKSLLLLFEKMKNLSNRIMDAKREVEISYDEEIFKLDAQEYHKKLTRQFTGFFSRLFSSEYRKIITDIRLNNKSGKKPSYGEAISLMEQLSELQKVVGEFESIDEKIKPNLGTAYAGVESDWDKIISDTTKAEKLLGSECGFDALAGMDNTKYQNYRKDFASKFQKIKEILAPLKNYMGIISESFDSSIYDVSNSEFGTSAEKMNACRDASGKLENWYRFSVVLQKLKELGLEGFVDDVIESGVSESDIVNSYKKNFFRQWIDCILHSSNALLSFNRISHEKELENFERQDRMQFEISKAQIREKISSCRPALDMMAPGSAVSILLREGEKKRKQKSVHTLLAEIPELIQILKPCFLMSPLSVSTFLTSEKIKFDLVVFDEASQIFPQDAIGAIYRGKQLIVVGDSRQMPPSNFFSSTVELEDDEDTGDITDFESILDLCSTAMTQLRLKWHYRSRFEELIAFSNKNFYDNDLTTFPSSITDRKWVGVDYYHVDGGLFDHKSKNNRKEAEYIVDLIFKNIEMYPNRSLGVVAFSVSQQDIIDRLLSARRQVDPSKEAFFRNDMQEPFFIKNLETVQGDERDTIIFSVGYAYDSVGKFNHFFGPLSRAGGERRLNVAVTRAKVNVQLVASIHYTDIDLGRTSSDGARFLREYLDYAENGQIALERSINVNQFEQFDSPFEQEVCEFLKDNGYEVDTQIGCSSFKIDMGLKRPGTSDYLLAIECDGYTYHSSKNARDRDRLRQDILESMGWKFYRIWSTDWFKNTEVEKERLLLAVNKALDTGEEDNIKSSNDGTEKTDESEKDNLFEETAHVTPLSFPKYQKVNERELALRIQSMQLLVKEILEVEAPLSEEWLLRRIVWMFGREKVTSVVQRDFEERMYGCERYGIIKRNGFLFLKDQTSYVMRVPADDETKRDIKYIAHEEIAAGMYIIIKQNISVERDGLYRTVARELGFQRVAENITNRFDAALYLLRDEVEESGNTVMLKHKIGV